MKISFDSQDLKQKPDKFNSFRERLHEIIFEAETPEGKLFDVILLGMILLSILVLMLETVPAYQARWQDEFKILDWTFTLFFTIEYLLRLYCVYSPKRYVVSFFGIIDLISILPSYLSIFFPGTQSLMIVRGLRLLRVFRIFKLDNFLHQGNVIVAALKSSRTKISIFMFFVLLLVNIFGSIMYLVEHEVNEGFNSIPRGIYWSIVTITTVGYGDISPVTPLGQMIASVIMIMGYAIIAVPTGIVTSAVMKAEKPEKSTSESCINCGKDGHDHNAVYCKFCGHHLNERG
jgi:voltage-gated potassium channel